MFRSVITLDEVKQKSNKSLANFYVRFHKNVNDIDRRVTKRGIETLEELSI